MNERRCDSLGGRIRIGGEVWAALISAVIAGLVAGGIMQATIAAHAKRLDADEAKIDQLMTGLAHMETSIEFLADAERRRQTMDDRQHP